MTTTDNTRSSPRKRNLFTSFIVPVIAATFIYRFLTARPPITVNYNKNKNDDASFSYTLTNKEIREYKKSGYVIIRGLFPPNQRDALIQAGKEYYSKRNLLDIVFSSTFKKLGMQIWRDEQAFADIALNGLLPDIAAQLLGQPRSIRLLKDGFFGLSSKANTGCGFHQDDRTFWPASDSTTGVNFWIPLSNVTAEDGGGIRVVPQNKISPEVDEECLSVIRSSNTSRPVTCDMETLSPSCFKTMMEVSVVHDLNAGDALIWDRRTFHASEPFRRSSGDDDDEESKLRYTVRYVPAEAIAEGMLHPSVEQGKRFDTPYHPQVWPSILPEEKVSIEKGLESDFPLVPIIMRMMKGKLGVAGPKSY